MCVAVVLVFAAYVCVYLRVLVHVLRLFIKLEVQVSLRATAKWLNSCRRAQKSSRQMKIIWGKQWRYEYFATIVKFRTVYREILKFYHKCTVI